MSTESRFWAKVEQSGECWLWTAAKDPAGYGRFQLGAGIGTVLAHRWSYEFMRVEIPTGLVIDHLCRTPACVNPWHLEPVTHAVNAARGIRGEQQRALTRCCHGHEYTPENTYILPGSGSRTCRTCKSIEGKRRWAAEKLARSA